MEMNGAPSLDLTALRTFLAVAESGGVSQAARLLHCVPSNVTVRIRRLEQDLGTPLFERHPRGMRLTTAGDRLLGYARQAVRLLAEAEEVVRGDSTPRGPLRIGASDTIAATHLPSLLASFCAEYEAVDVTLSTAPSAVLAGQVRARRLDGAFLSSAVAPEGVEAIPAWRDRLHLMTAAQVASPESLRRRAAIVSRPGCAYRAQFERWLEEKGWHAWPVQEFASLEVAVACVAAGMGMTVIPESALLRLQVEGTVRLHPLPDHLAEMTVWFALPRGVASNAALQAFREHLPPVPVLQNRTEPRKGGTLIHSESHHPEKVS